MFSTQFNAIADHITPLGPARLNKRSDPCCEWFVILFFTLAVLWNSLKLSSQTMGIPSSFKSTFSTSFTYITISKLSIINMRSVIVGCKFTILYFRYSTHI